MRGAWRGPDGEDQHAPIKSERERELGGACLGGDRDEVDDQPAEDGARSDPAYHSGDGHDSAAKAHDPSERGRARALCLEVEELALVVPEVGEDAEQDSDEGERKRDDRAREKREQGPARERIVAEGRLEPGPGAHREDGERWPLQCSRDLTFARGRGAQPDLARNRRTWALGVHRPAQELAIGDDEIA
jgi:hypothetical protein